MAVIQRMSAHLANLIAAGEVVERPASVVKELLENAVDAGASVVTVEIRGGGMTFIRVADNGCGMSREDAEVAFLRHATSKLHSEAELASIGTLGFRGEALAAIAAVSRIDLLTSNGRESVSLRLEAGAIVSREEAACPQGTTVIVRDLFFNTPARLKFMKHDSAEGAQVHAVVQRQALANPSVRYRLLRDGKEVLSTPGDGELESALYAVLGRQMALDMSRVSGSWGEIRVEGYVTRPTATRGNRNYQHFFVNGRYVRSKLLTAALEQAYQNQLPAGRFPGCVLHIWLPLTQVDVNVHPAKTEVKFLSEQTVFDAVHYGVLSALNRTPGRPEADLKAAPVKAAPALAAQTSLPTPAAPKGYTAPKGSRIAAPQTGFYRTMSAEDYRTMARTLAEQPPHPAAPSVQRRVFSGATAPNRAASLRPVLPRMEDDADETPLIPETPAAKAGSVEKLPEKPAEQVEMASLPPVQSWRLVGEVLQTYLVIDEGDGMLLIDKHAAHERILFERLRAQQTQMMSQSLLEPQTAALNGEETAAVLEHCDLLAQFGYGLEPDMAGAALLTRIPAELDADEAEVGLQALAQQLLDGHAPDVTALRDTALHTIACKAAVKAGSISDRTELEALAREVLSRDDIKYCPHGRPVCISVSRSTIERQFGRT